MATIFFLILKLSGSLFISWFWIIVVIAIDVWPVNKIRELKNEIEELEEKIQRIESKN